MLGFRISFQALALCLFCSATVPIAVSPAAEYSSPKGFSFQYPDSWRIATGGQQVGVKKLVQKTFKGINPERVRRLAVVLLDSEQDEFVENVNVVIAKGRMPLEKESDDEILKMLKQQWARLGLSVRVLKHERIKIQGRPAFSVQYESQFAQQSGPVRQWAVMVPGNGRTYIMTCSAAAKDFERYQPIFNQIISSFRVDTGLAGWWYALPPVLRSAILGGAIGGLAGAGVALALRAIKRSRERTS